MPHTALFTLHGKVFASPGLSTSTCMCSKGNALWMWGFLPSFSRDQCCQLSRNKTGQHSVETG